MSDFCCSLIPVTFPEGGFSASLFAADRCLFSQNRPVSAQNPQLQQIHRLCTSRLQIASSVSLRKRTRPAPAKAAATSLEPKKDIEMTALSRSVNEDAKLLKPVIQSLGKSLASSGESGAKSPVETSKDAQTADTESSNSLKDAQSAAKESSNSLKDAQSGVKETIKMSKDAQSGVKETIKISKDAQTVAREPIRKRPIRMARIVDYVFCVGFRDGTESQGDIDDVYTRLLSVIDINYLFHRQNCIVCVSLFCEAPDSSLDSLATRRCSEDPNAADAADSALRLRPVAVLQAIVHQPGARPRLLLLRQDDFELLRRSRRLSPSQHSEDRSSAAR